MSSDGVVDTKKIDYDVNDPDLRELIMCMALGSKANFAYTPSMDEILDYMGVKSEKQRKDLEMNMDEEKKREIAETLIEAEKELPFTERKV